MCKQKLTVGELMDKYMSDTTIVRIIETTGIFHEIEDIIYEEFIGEWERKDLLDKKVDGFDAFIYDKDIAGVNIYIQ